jgi:predicted AAA+ superfamily ATPase
VPASTIREYYAVLSDTLVGFMVEPWTASRKRKAIATAKFCFFDTGVVHALTGTRTLDRNSDLYGRSFEHWIGLELRAFLGYRRIREEGTFRRLLLVSQDAVESSRDGVRCLHWRTFLHDLWNGRLVAA